MDNKIMVVILDYGMGNIGSIFNMLKKIGADAVISNDKLEIDRADKIILPGVGSFDNGMNNLIQLGLDALIQQQVIINKKKNDKLLEGITGIQRYYFVHSYHAVCDDTEDILMTCDYGYPFPAAIKKGNIYGVQFHPEKSHRFGMDLLSNFIRSV